MNTKTKIYKVTCTNGDAIFVSATSKAGARRACGGKISQIEAYCDTWEELHALQSPAMLQIKSEA